MNDELDSATGLATHIGAPGVIGGLTAWATNFFRSSREERDRAARSEAEKQLAVTLGVLKEKMDQLIADVREHKQVFEKVVLTGQAVETLGQKLDDLRGRVQALEQTRRGGK